MSQHSRPWRESTVGGTSSTELLGEGFESLCWLFKIGRETRGVIDMSLHEAALLWRLVLEQDGPVLELGRTTGATTLLLARAARHRPGGGVCSVGDVMAMHPETYEELLNYDVQVLTQNARFSPRPMRRWGLVLVDGHTQYRTARRDIQRHWQELSRNRKGGVMAVHDAMPCEGDPGAHSKGVARAVAELLRREDAEVYAVAGSLVAVRRRTV